MNPFVNPWFDLTEAINIAVVIWMLSVLLFLYVAFFYPVLLSLAASGRSFPEDKKLHFRKVSIILAVYNGEHWIAPKLETILALNYPRDLMEILVVSDGSTDSTDDIVGRYAGQGVQLIRVPHAGKAAALNVGMSAATGDILFFTDVRQKLSPDALRNLVACFDHPKVGVATGELIIGDGRASSGVARYWSYESTIRSNMSRLGVLHAASGCIYAMRRDLARPLPDNTILDDVYLPISAFLQGYAVVFEPGAKAFDIPVGLRIEFARKLRTLSGVCQILCAYPKLLWPGTRGGFHFLSHKLGRMILPYAFICCVVSSFWFPQPWKTIILSCQVGVFVLALIDVVLRPSSRIKPFTSPALTFLVLMAAALLAIPAIFLPHDKLWRPRITQPPCSQS
jgi:poly-beta-1,6-N-acetyl-D-glucosamine synthase